jgi:lipoprotein-anchoring transpeptidase ErfK/SrfK
MLHALLPLLATLPPVRPLLLAFLLLLGLPAAAAAQAPLPGERIAVGLSSAGVDLSGLTVEEAAARLDATLGPRLAADLVVSAGRRVFTLPVARARLKLDSVRTAKRALYAGRRQAPGAPPLAVAPALGHARLPVRAFAARVDRAVSRAPRNATLRIGLRRMHVTRARTGLDLDERGLAARIDAALDDPAAPRVVRGVRRTVYPPVNVNDLRRTYGTVVTVDRRTFRLRLFKRLRFAKSYRIAVGMAGYETPAGLFRVQSRQVNPAWHAPNRPWAGSLAGRTVPGGAPNNPLKARWLGLAGGVGIHGTGEPMSIGSRASHGCIRMRVSDVIDLYRRVPLGTPVLVR